MNRNYGKRGEVKSNRGEVRKYLGINFDLAEKEKVEIKMDDYVERMINNFPIKINKSDMALTPAGNNIFEKVNRKIWVKKKL